MLSMPNEAKHRCVLFIAMFVLSYAFAKLGLVSVANGVKCAYAKRCTLKRSATWTLIDRLLFAQTSRFKIGGKYMLMLTPNL